MRALGLRPRIRYSSTSSPYSTNGVIVGFYLQSPFSTTNSPQNPISLAVQPNFIKIQVPSKISQSRALIFHSTSANLHQTLIPWLNITVNPKTHGRSPNSHPSYLISTSSPSSHSQLSSSPIKESKVAEPSFPSNPSIGLYTITYSSFQPLLQPSQHNCNKPSPFSHQPNLYQGQSQPTEHF